MRVRVRVCRFSQELAEMVLADQQKDQLQATNVSTCPSVRRAISRMTFSQRQPPQTCQLDLQPLEAAHGRTCTVQVYSDTNVHTQVFGETSPSTRLQHPPALNMTFPNCLNQYCNLIYVILIFRSQRRQMKARLLGRAHPCQSCCRRSSQ